MSQRKDINYLSFNFSSNAFLINATSSILHKTLTNIIIQHNNNETPCNAPQLSLSEYLNRIITYTQIEFNTLITSLIYIDRYCLQTNTKLTYINVYKLLTCGILVSIKYNEDVIFHMKYYAKVFGVSEKELRKMERAFVMKMNFDFYVKKELFEQYYEYIYNEVCRIEKQFHEMEITEFHKVISL